MTRTFEIRNSTAEFLIFQIKGKVDGLQVVYRDESIWCTQKAMGQLFDVGVPAISKHLKNIFETGELIKDMVVSKMEITTGHGAIPNKTQTKDVTFYNLNTIISVGYRANSTRATQFRQWCTFVLPNLKIWGVLSMPSSIWLSEWLSHIPMTMDDWAKRIDIILETTGDAVLTDAGKITAEFVKSFAESKF